MKRFEALDSLRGVSALLVVLYHLDQDVWTSWRGAAWLTHLDLVVDFFFVLSGFVIANAYAERLKRGGEIVPFLLRRASRLLPLHWFVLLSLVAFAIVRVIAAAPPFDPRAVFDGGIYDLSAIVTNTLMLHGVGFENHLTWNYPSWSISGEFWTYVIFALIWGVFAMRSTAIATALTIACPLLVILFPSDSLSVMTLARVVGGFAAGVVVHTLFVRAAVMLEPWLRQHKLATFIEIGAAALTALYILDVGTIWFAPYMFAVCVFVFAMEAGAVSRALRAPPMLTLGALSYSIYMTHAAILMMSWSIITWVERATGWTLTTPFGDDRLWGTSPWIGNLVVVGVIALVIAVSSATYRWIELPGQAWGQRAADRWTRGALFKRQAPAQTPAAN